MHTHTHTRTRTHTHTRAHIQQPTHPTINTHTYTYLFALLGSLFVNLSFGKLLERAIDLVARIADEHLGVRRHFLILCKLEQLLGLRQRLIELVLLHPKRHAEGRVLQLHCCHRQAQRCNHQR